MSARPELERFPFTFVHGNRSRLLFGRIFRAAKYATWLENAYLLGRIFRAAKHATWLENAYRLGRIFRAAKYAAWLENAPAHHD